MCAGGDSDGVEVVEDAMCEEDFGDESIVGDGINEATKAEDVYG